MCVKCRFTLLSYLREVDTFRRDIVVDGSALKGSAGIMRTKIAKTYNLKLPVLFNSSTNNPVMVKSWRKDGYKIVEEETIFGNKYQAFKLLT